jgi:hypothetical protein
MEKRATTEGTDEAVSVRCDPAADGWHCVVTVGDDPAATEHRVSVDRDTLQRLGDGATPEELVRASFGFLLEREPRESIMRAFDLSLIARFFGDYEDEIRRRMVGGRG